MAKSRLYPIFCSCPSTYLYHLVQEDKYLSRRYSHQWKSWLVLNSKLRRVGQDSSHVDLKVHFSPSSTWLRGLGQMGAPWSSGFQWVQLTEGAGRRWRVGGKWGQLWTYPATGHSHLTRATAPRGDNGSQTHRAPEQPDGATPEASLIFITDLKPPT